MWTEKGALIGGLEENKDCFSLSLSLLFFWSQMPPDSAPHFYVLSRGKQTEPCSAGTWLFCPLFYGHSEAVSGRGMKSALTGVDVYVSERLPAGDLNSQLQPMHQCLGGVLKCAALHRRGCIMSYASAPLKSLQRWLPEWFDTHVSVM